MRDRAWTRHDDAFEDAGSFAETCGGSALIEAVVGIGLIALLLGATFTTHRAMTAAVARAEARTAAVRLVERALEHPDPTTVPVAVVTGGRDAPPPCTSTSVGAGPHHEAATSGDDAVQLVPTVLRGPVRGGADDAGGAPALRVHVPAHGWSVMPTVELHGPSGARVGVVGDVGCWEFRDLTLGTHDVIVRAGATSFIDPTHVLLEDRPLRIGISGGATDTTAAAAEPVMLTVHAETDGGRTPDAVHPGTLGWLVEGDDARLVTPLGEPRPVHPGRVVVVVSACGNPGAPASHRAVDVSIPTAAVDVPLAIVRIEGVAGRADATLELVRREGCADGTGVRPSLRWIGGLVEGMRIALPAGVWEGRLLSATGARLTAAVTVHASTETVTLVLP